MAERINPEKIEAIKRSRKETVVNNLDRWIIQELKQSGVQITSADENEILNHLLPSKMEDENAYNLENMERNIATLKQGGLPGIAGGIELSTDNLSSIVDAVFDRVKGKGRIG